MMYIYNLKSIAKKMKIDFDEITSKIMHNPTKGTIREELLKTCFLEFLPEKYSIGNGIIINSDEFQSKQQDFIIYDALNSPKMLKSQAFQILPVESIYSVIEIKSTLTTNELENTLYLFYLLILHHLYNTKLSPPNLIEYARKQKAFIKDAK